MFIFPFLFFFGHYFYRVWCFCVRLCGSISCSRPSSLSRYQWPLTNFKINLYEIFINFSLDHCYSYLILIFFSTNMIPEKFLTLPKTCERVCQKRHRDGKKDAGVSSDNITLCKSIPIRMIWFGTKVHKNSFKILNYKTNILNYLPASLNLHSLLILSSVELWPAGIFPQNLQQENRIFLQQQPP